MPPNTVPFLTGAVTMGYGIAGLFFLRFWVRSRDRLFLAFAGAFWLLTCQSAVAIIGSPDEPYSAWYLLRLGAYSLIIWGIFAKNRGRPGRQR
ncbi:MAG: hypothetical protein JO227_21255 [Acetobacteraceae bacterium]|nr:hypothetical protein [Acetobacteraceae bacterium]